MWVCTPVSTIQARSRTFLFLRGDRSLSLEVEGCQSGSIQAHAHYVKRAYIHWKYLHGRKRSVMVV